MAGRVTIVVDLKDEVEQKLDRGLVMSALECILGWVEFLMGGVKVTRMSYEQLGSVTGEGR